MKVLLKDKNKKALEEKKKEEDAKAAEAARVAELKAKQNARKNIRKQGGTVVEGELGPSPFNQLPASSLTDSLVA